MWEGDTKTLSGYKSFESLGEKKLKLIFLLINVNEQKKENAET